MSNLLMNAKLWKDGVGGLVEGGGLMCIKRNILAKFVCWFRGKKVQDPLNVFYQINHHGFCNFFLLEHVKTLLPHQKNIFFQK